MLSYLIYIAALMCSHLSAFRGATNLRLAVPDAMARIDSVLEAAPMQVQAISQHPQDTSVTLQDVHFS